MEKGEGTKRPERRAARLPVAFRSSGGSGKGETTEVSLRGVFVKTDEPLRERKLVHLSLDMPEGQEIELHGMVEKTITVDGAKTEDRAPGMAIRFYGLGLRAQSIWEAFVQSSKEAQPPESGEEKDRPSVESVLVDESYLDAVEKAKAIASEPTNLLDKRAAEAVAPVEQTGHAPAGDQTHAVFCIKLSSIEALESFSISALDTGGMHVSVPRSLLEGRKVVIRIVHPTSGHEFHIPGEVTESSPPRPGVSVRFLEATDVTREAFGRFVNCAAARSPGSELSLAEAPPTIPERASDWSIENTFEISADDLVRLR